MIASGSTTVVSSMLVSTLPSNSSPAGSANPIKSPIKTVSDGDVKDVALTSSSVAASSVPPHMSRNTQKSSQDKVTDIEKRKMILYGLYVILPPF